VQYFNAAGRTVLTSSLVFHPAKISQSSRGCVRKRELICTQINCPGKAGDFIRDNKELRVQHGADMVIKVVIIILLAANFGHNFPVTNKKLPSTYDDKECPPGFLPCISEKDRDVPGPARGRSSPSPASPNTTTANATEATAPTPSRARNHGVTETTSKVPPGESMEGTWDSKEGEQQGRHICPPGIWVC